MRRAPEKHQARLDVGGAAFRKHIGPDVFSVGEHGGDKLRHAVIRRGTVRRPLLLLHLRRWRAAAEQAQNGQRVDAKHPAAQQRHHDGAYAYATPAQQTTAAETATTAAAVIAPVFDVVRFPIAFPFHDRPCLKKTVYPELPCVYADFT